MKRKNFTLLSTALCIATAFTGSYAVAQNSQTGTGWDNLNPSSPIVIDEDFTGFEFLHSRDHANQGNSKTTVDETTLEIIWGHRDEVKQVPFINSDAYATYDFDTCAFAPEWGVAASVDGSGAPVTPDPTTSRVSKGFVEISRLGYGDRPGEFLLDLRQLPFVEGIQYSHSSTGGKRRGLMVLFSIDDAATWDTLRFQPGDLWSLSYTKDVFTGEKTMNIYNCEPSASGMLWEDAIYSENVMLKFKACDDQDTLTNIAQQAVRLHDLKVYGDLPVSVDAIQQNELKVRLIQGELRISEMADVRIYNLSGALVLQTQQTNLVNMQALSEGIYLVNAINSRGQMSTQKVLLQKN